MKRRYLIILEPTGTGYSAFAPDVPGCVATGRTIGETYRVMQKAVDIHFDALRRERLPVPKPTSQVAYVEV